MARLSLTLLRHLSIGGSVLTDLTKQILTKQAVLRVTIGRKQDKAVGCFYIVIAPDKTGRWKVIDQDPIAGWRTSSKRGMLAINVWRKWSNFRVSDYRATVSFARDGGRPDNREFNDIFPPRPIPAWSRKNRARRKGPNRR